MIKIFSRLKDFFIKTYYPEVSFSFLPHYIAGIKVTSRGKKLNSYFICSLPQDVLKPSFYELNIINYNYLKEIFEKEIIKLRNLPSTISILIPEQSTRVFFLDFDSLPSKKEEIEHLVLWRVKKLIPLPENGVRLAWQKTSSQNGIKIIAFLASEKVVTQYEEFFSELKFHVGLIESPIFNLFNIVQKELKGNHLLINIENWYLTILGFNDLEFLIYRSKYFSSLNKNEILKEIDHTMKFLKDKSGIEIDSLLLRIVDSEDELEWSEILKRNFLIPSIFIDPFSSNIKFDSSIENLSFYERQILSPLIGQTLWKNLSL
jgi:hypothetical protein